jgi:formate dehydrogenase subunit delta
MKQSDTLVRMANQIARNLAIQGEERAVDAAAKHIRLFWEPRMKAAIFAHIDAGGEGLDPLALKALRKLQASLTSDTSPAKAPKKPQSGSNGQRARAVSAR